jgi:predicted O-methyltransferase YrrM
VELNKIYENVKRIKSTSFMEEVMLLYGYVKELPMNCSIVELGTGLGRSTAAMAYACKGTSRKIYTVDNYVQGTKFTNEVNSAWNAQSAKTNIISLGLEEYVQFFNCDTTDKSLILAIPTPIQMIFIDAGHSYEGVKKDIEFWKPYIAKDGIMCGHDWSFAYPEGIEVVKAVAETVLQPTSKFQVEYRLWKTVRNW